MGFKRLIERLREPDMQRFVTFVVTGGVAALVNVASCALLGQVLTYEIAVLLAYVVGMTTAFFLAKLFVFSSAGRALHIEYARFALVNVAAMVQVFVVSVVLARGLFPLIGLVSHADLLAHAIAVASPILLSYQGHKRFSFA